MPYGFDVDVGGWTAAHELGPEGPSRDPRWIHGKEMEYWRSLVYASGVPTSIETSADVHMFECYHPEDLTIDQALRRIRWQTASIRKFWAQDRPLAAILQTCNPPANSLVAGRPYSPEFFRAMVEELVRLGVQPVLWANPNGRAVVSVIMPSLVSLPATWSFNIQIAARSATVVVTRPGTVNATTIAEATRAAVQAAFAAATPVAGSVRAGLTPVTLPTLAVTNRNVGGETYIDLRATDTYPPDWQPFYTLLFNGSASGRGDNGWGTVVRTIVTSGDSSHPSATDDDWALGAFAPTLAVLRTVFESGVSRSPRGARDTSARESVIATTSTPPGGRSRARNRRRR
jgi:hypothetical protein